MKKSFLSLSRLMKQVIVMTCDSFAIVIAVFVSYSIRLDKVYFPSGVEYVVYLLAIVIALPIFIKFGLYREIFRYTGKYALLAILKAVLVYAISFTVVIYLWDFLHLPDKSEVVIPRSLAILHSVILLFFIFLSRSIAVYWLTTNAGFFKANRQRRILVYGAGSSGMQIGAALQQSSVSFLVGYIDDDQGLRHKKINGVKIYGIDELECLISEYGVTEVLLAMPSIPQGRRNEILMNLSSHKLYVRSLPSISDIVNGKIHITDIAELDIADLLGRVTVEPNKDLFKKNIFQKVVMVSGAGGSIGSELARQIIAGKPKTLILLEQNEFALYALDAELKSRIKHEQESLEIFSLLGSVSNHDLIKKICQRFSVDTVYHAAAYKHVPIVEHNVREGLINNVWGTLSIVKACIASNVSNFVLVSTDKAVRPTNVMGASKRLAEMIVQAFAHQEKITTTFSIVRFGNVLGSSGSVVPLFRKQIINGGPITLTDPNVTRYFMTITEAAQLVIQAGALSSSSTNANGDVYVLDMGEPVKILNLAKKMIELAGLRVRDQDNVDGDIPIEIIGLRPGEKLYEELLIGNNPIQTFHPKIMKAQENFLSWGELESALNNLESFLEKTDMPSVYEMLKFLVSGFKPNPKIVDYLFSINSNACDVDVENSSA